MGWLFSSLFSIVYFPIDWLIVKPLGWLTKKLIVEPIEWMITTVVKWILFDLQTYWILAFLGLMFLNVFIGLDMFAAIGMSAAFGLAVSFLRSLSSTINQVKCTTLQLEKIDKISEYGQVLKKFEKLKANNTRVKNTQNVDPMEPNILKYIHEPKSLVDYIIPNFRVGFYIAWTIAISLTWTTFGLSLEIMGAMTLSTIVGELLFKSFMAGEVLANESTLAQDITEIQECIDSIEQKCLILEKENQQDSVVRAKIEDEAKESDQTRENALTHYYQAQSSRRQDARSYTKLSELSIREITMIERVYSQHA